MNDRQVVPPPAPPPPFTPGASPAAVAALKNGEPAVQQPPKQRPHDDGSVKETVEQILVAFILAFIFRAYVVEAFVIPTGSMAPTLLGAHTRYACPDCGYEFDVNFNAKQSGDDLNIPARVTAPDYNPQVRAVCPNCGYQLRNSEPGDPAYAPFVRYGDRILVLKYLYLFEPPRRWDVVVFKSPDRPKDYDYTLNYIKRLIGRPGEAVMILDGDIYAGPKDAKPEDLKIQTKSRDVQDALWRIIYDNDYQPRGQARFASNDPSVAAGIGFRQPWTRVPGQDGWDDGTSPARAFRFQNDNGAADLLFNDRVNVLAGGRPSAFSDWLAYDVENGRNDWNMVGDLKLDLFYERSAGEGPLRLTLSKRGEKFIAEITPGSARLLHVDVSNNETEVIPATTFKSHGGPMHVVFSNVDYRVTLRIDGGDVLQTTEQQYHPDVAALLAWHHSNARAQTPAVSISAAKQTCTISHLSVWRDVYYLNRGTRPDAVSGKTVPFSASPENVMRLNDDEYFVLGDNSQISGDGRYWGDPTVLPYEQLWTDAGKVPARFMLGKAFFVYWPAGYRPMERESMPAVVPNFGDMRFIH